MQKKINEQEAQVLQMVKKSSSMFPEKKDFHKYNDAAIGFASIKKPNKFMLEKLDSFGNATIGQNSQQVPSPLKFDKKTVRLMINEGDGAVRIEHASPDA